MDFSLDKLLMILVNCVIWLYLQMDFLHNWTFHHSHFPLSAGVIKTIPQEIKAYAFHWLSAFHCFIAIRQWYFWCLFFVPGTKRHAASATLKWKKLVIPGFLYTQNKAIYNVKKSPCMKKFHVKAKISIDEVNEKCWNVKPNPVWLIRNWGKFAWFFHPRWRCHVLKVNRKATHE